MFPSLVLFALLSSPPHFEIVSQPALSPSDISIVVRTLASPPYNGRKSGTEGGHMAGDWLANRMELMGLSPGWEGGFFQPFDLAIGLGERQSFLVIGEDTNLFIGELDTDFAPLKFSMDGQVDGPVWLAGFGIEAPDEGWNDWADDEGNPLEIDGGVVVLFRGLPDLPENHPLLREERRGLGNVNTKIQVAKEHGASAVLFVDPLPEQGLKHPPGSFRYGRSALPSGLLSWELFSLLFPLEKSPDLVALLSPFAPKQSKENLSFSTNQVVLSGVGRNILGFLDGPPDSPFVVLGAHYDHLGDGAESSMAPSLVGTPHWGADDNASGTALVLEIAHHLASIPLEQRPARILFALFDGEEMGLLGSQHLVSHFPEDLEEVDFMINADMVGRLADSGQLLLGGGGSATQWGDSLTNLPVPAPLVVTLSLDGAGRSDHISFLSQEIPSLFLFTGAHGDYHKPSDTPDKVDIEGTYLIAQYTETLLWYLAPRVPLTFNAPPQRTGGARGGYGPWFGSIPDFTPHEEPGYWISGTSPGSPAERGGLVAGDRIVEIDDRSVEDIYGFTGIIRTLRPGDEVMVVFFRGKERREALLVLGRRE